MPFHYGSLLFRDVRYAAVATCSYRFRCCLVQDYAPVHFVVALRCCWNVGAVATLRAAGVAVSGGAGDARDAFARGRRTAGTPRVCGSGSDACNATILCLLLHST